MYEINSSRLELFLLLNMSRHIANCCPIPNHFLSLFSFVGSFLIRIRNSRFKNPKRTHPAIKSSFYGHIWVRDTLLSFYFGSFFAKRLIWPVGSHRSEFVLDLVKHVHWSEEKEKLKRTAQNFNVCNLSWRTASQSGFSCGYSTLTQIFADAQNIKQRKNIVCAINARKKRKYINPMRELNMWHWSCFSLALFRLSL